MAASALVKVTRASPFLQPFGVKYSFIFFIVPCGPNKISSELIVGALQGRGTAIPKMNRNCQLATIVSHITGNVAVSHF